MDFLNPINSAASIWVSVKTYILNIFWSPSWCRWLFWFIYWWRAVGVLHPLSHIMDFKWCFCCGCRNEERGAHHVYWEGFKWWNIQTGAICKPLHYKSPFSPQSHHQVNRTLQRRSQSLRRKRSARRKKSDAFVIFLSTFHHLSDFCRLTAS